MATNNTQVTREGIDQAVKGLRELMPAGTMSEFDALRVARSPAGPPGLEALRWIQDVVVDRSNGVVEHARNVRFVFEGLADRLTTVAGRLTDQDSNNAGSLVSGARSKPQS